MDDVILYDDDRAAKRETREVWASRDGYVYIDESSARWAGRTHIKCETCGTVYPKRAYCEPCREKRDDERWAAMEEVEWDGTTPLCLFDGDEFFFDDGEIEDYCDAFDIEDPNSLRLELCKPVYGREIDPDDFYDCLPEEGELPESILDAMKVFNAAVREAGPLSWTPCGKRVRLTTEGTT